MLDFVIWKSEAYDESLTKYYEININKDGIQVF